MTAEECAAKFLEYCRDRCEHPSVDRGYVSQDGKQFTFLYLGLAGWDLHLVPNDFEIRGRRYSGVRHTAHPCIFVAKLQAEKMR